MRRRFLSGSGCERVNTITKLKNRVSISIGTPVHPDWEGRMTNADMLDCYRQLTISQHPRRHWKKNYKTSACQCVTRAVTCGQASDQNMIRFAFLTTLLPLALAQSWLGLPGSNYNPQQPWGFSASASWPQLSLGQPIIPQAPDTELQAMLGEIDPARIKAIVTTLANFGTRHTLSNQTNPVRGIGAARDWIYRQMSSIANSSNGNMDVQIQSYTQGVDDRIYFPVKLSNVVARINGTSDANRTYVVTGHYDSRRIDIADYTGDAPGADDDATGVAGESSAMLMSKSHLPCSRAGDGSSLRNPTSRRIHNLCRHRGRGARSVRSKPPRSNPAECLHQRRR